MTEAADKVTGIMFDAYISAHRIERSTPEADELWRAAGQDVLRRADESASEAGLGLSHDDLQAAKAKGLGLFLEWELERSQQRRSEI